MYLLTGTFQLSPAHETRVGLLTFYVSLVFDTRGDSSGICRKLACALWGMLDCILQVPDAYSSPISYFGLFTTPPRVVYSLNQAD
jgi:hypothetical protein